MRKVVEEGGLFTVKRGAFLRDRRRRLPVQLLGPM
jgi:hypothetical protein